MNWASCFSWEECFVSLSWSKNSDVVTNKSVKLFCFRQKEDIKSQTQDMVHKCSNIRNLNANLMKMGQRAFLTNLQINIDAFYWVSLCRLRGMHCNPFWSKNTYVVKYGSVNLFCFIQKGAIKSLKRNMNLKRCNIRNHYKNFIKMGHSISDCFKINNVAS